MFICVHLWFLSGVSTIAAEMAWTDSGEGFRSGTLGDSGQNLYVNPRGELETIRRFDIDGDGNLDLLSNSGHDMYYAVPATVATASKDGTVRATQLGVDGSSRVVPADLNRDGFTDLVFLPNVSNIQYAHRGSLRIAWGGPDGWSASRITRQLPVDGGFGAEDSWLPTARLAVGDLNGDGWPDLLTLNGTGWLFGQPEGRIVRVFWGSDEGFLLTSYFDLGVADAIEIATGKFGPSGEYPAVVLTSHGELKYLHADKSGRALAVARTFTLQAPGRPGAAKDLKFQCIATDDVSDSKGTTLWIGTDLDVLLRLAPAGAADDLSIIKAKPATHVTVGRLDDDPYPDVVLTDLKLVFRSDLSRASHAASVSVLWGGAKGMDGAPTTLSIPNAIFATVGDLNGDGHGDLFVSVHQGDTTMKASSLVYFGNGTRTLPAEAQPVPTEGAQQAVITRASSSRPPALVVANSMSYTLDAAVPALLYWGTAKGLSRDSVTEIPNLGGLKSSLSDLNADGYVDLILINGGDVAPETIARAPNVGANIYWGGPDGSIGGPGKTRFDKTRRQILRESYLCSINVADLNADGWLDLVLGAYESKTSPDTEISIYYGSARGYSVERRRQIHVPSRGFGLAIADYNRDGRLDIAIIGYANDLVTAYWGTPDGYDDQHKFTLPYPAPIELETADLNNDGWQDLLVSSYYDPITHDRDTGLSIFWGEPGPRPWRQSNSQWLPGLTAQAMAVADLDKDGYLDLVAPNYHGQLTREHLPSYIYWGGAEGFTAHRRTLLDVDSAVDVMVADFDHDGLLDLGFTAHSVNAGHRVESPVYYNDGHRFTKPRATWLPVIGPFYGWEQDPGNIANRRYEETFTSRVFSWDDSRTRGELTADAVNRYQSSVSIEFRSAPDDASLEHSPWQKADRSSFRFAPADRRLQYRLTLKSANGDAYPIVRKVDVRLK